MISSLLFTIAIATPRPPAMADLDKGGEVRSMKLIDGKLFVSGTFERANRKLANNIAFWDGTEWQTLGKGVDGPVHDFCAVGKDIYVCGDFSYVNKGKNDEGTPATRIAKWDGTKWSAIAARPVDREIFSLATDGKNLYLGGNFTKINDETETRGVAKYDGKTITSIGGQFDRGVMSMTWLEGKLYVGGIFNEFGDDVMSHTAVWDGKSWSELGGGLPGSVYQITNDGKNVYAAPKPGGIFKLEGNKWNEVIKVDGEVTGLRIVDGKFYIGGDIRSVNGKETHHVAVVDGGKVSTLKELLYARHLVALPYGGGTVIGGNYGSVQNANHVGGVLMWKGGTDLDSFSK